MTITPQDLLDARILIVDDQPANLRLLEDLLAREGFTNVVSTTESTQVMDLHGAFDPDLVLLDLMMPGLSGYAVLEQLERQRPADEFRPVLVLTADATSQAKRRALSLGAKDFLTKPFDPVEAMLRVGIDRGVSRTERKSKISFSKSPDSLERARRRWRRSAEKRDEPASCIPEVGAEFIEGLMLSGPVVLTILIATSLASSILPVIFRPTTCKASSMLWAP